MCLCDAARTTHLATKKIPVTLNQTGSWARARAQYFTWSGPPYRDLLRTLIRELLLASLSNPNPITKPVFYLLLPSGTLFSLCSRAGILLGFMPWGRRERRQLWEQAFEFEGFRSRTFPHRPRRWSDGGVDGGGSGSDGIHPPLQGHQDPSCHPSSTQLSSLHVSSILHSPPTLSFPSSFIFSFFL